MLDWILSARNWTASKVRSIPFLGFLLNNSRAHFEVGRLDVDSESTHKARNKTIFKIFYFTGFSVGSKNDLFASEVKGVEGVKKFFLDIFFAGEKLDVVN